MGEFGVVILGYESAFESFFFLAKRAVARKEAGSDEVCDLEAYRRLLSALLALSSSSLVSCSPSWPSAIGLSLSFPVIKRCRIESSIFDV